MNKRFTTVELPTPNSWDIMSDGEYLSTYQTCPLLNDYNDKITNLEKVNKHLREENDKKSELIQKLTQENDRLITKTAETISKHQQKILNLIDTKINEYQQYAEYDTEKWYIGTELLKELKKRS